MQNLNMGVDAGSNRGRNALLFDLKGVGRNRYIDVVNPNYVKTEKGRPARSQRSETLSASPALEDESLGNLITTSPEKPSAQYKEVQKEPAESDPGKSIYLLATVRQILTHGCCTEIQLHVPTVKERANDAKLSKMEVN
eukprot:GHVT01060096.1.p3 GENE.GHVT01060096.1~~GHVT01060096.1.p3  ORF type:complete len:139 (+),score=10.38 GHVT01060096.1:1617-2033(+)